MKTISSIVALGLSIFGCLNTAHAAETYAEVYSAAELASLGTQASDDDFQYFFSLFGSVPAASATSSVSHFLPASYDIDDPLVANASATADLFNGILRASGSGNCFGTVAVAGGTTCSAGGAANAHARLGDFFNFAGATPVSLAHIQFAVDGILAAGPGSLDVPTASAALNFSPAAPIGVFPDTLHASFSASLAGIVSDVSGGWINPHVSSSLSGAGQLFWSFSGYLPLADFRQYGVDMTLDIDAPRGAAADFDNTATLQIGITPDISFSPGSNSFGAVRILSAVPEPSTWMLLILGFGGIGSALRRTQAHRPNAIDAAGRELR